MHAHGTAVLSRPAEAVTWTIPAARSRDQWLAKCESLLATALDTGNAALLPEPAGFLPEPDRCPDCLGTGYDSETLDLCYCMAGQRPAYDFLRHSPGKVPLSMYAQSRHNSRQADVWHPCPCGTLPIKGGPYCKGDLIRVPWAPDCTICNDTGWKFSHSTSALGAFPW